MVLCSLRVPFFNCVQSLLRQRCAQRALCPVLHTGLDLLTLEAAICANMQVLTPHAFLRTLFIFFKCVVSQRRRLICISLRGRLSENAMIKLGHLLTCLFYIFFLVLFIQRPLGILAQAEALVAPMNCPETRKPHDDCLRQLHENLDVLSSAFLAPGRNCPHLEHFLANWLLHVVAIFLLGIIAVFLRDRIHG